MQRTSIATPAGPVSVLQAGHGRRLHFAHATGMNAALYGRLLAPLDDIFAITASDARGHGLTGLPADPAALTSWDEFAADLNQLLDVIDGQGPWLLAGHSMGAAVSLLAAAARPERVAGLVLVDPALLPFETAARVRAGETVPNPMADQAARRRGLFHGRAEARAAYHGRGVFRTWADDDLDAYLDGGLIIGDDGAALACTPAFESATFRAVSPNIEAALAAIACPFVLLAGEQGSTVAAAELAAFAAHPACLAAERVAGTTHFLPLERPDRVREAVMKVSSSSAAP